MTWNDLMANTYFTGIILPLIAAVLATYVLEFFFKPQLESRKKRIIHSRDQTDKIIWYFQKISLAAYAVKGLEIALSSTNNPNKRKSLEYAINDRYFNLSNLIGTLEESLSELSPSYINKNKDAIKQTSVYLGMLKGAAIYLQNESDNSVLINLIEESHRFDIYFRVYTGFHESQEKFSKKLLWKIFNKDKYLKNQKYFLDSL